MTARKASHCGPCPRHLSRVRSTSYPMTTQDSLPGAGYALPGGLSPPLTDSREVGQGSTGSHRKVSVLQLTCHSGQVHILLSQVAWRNPRFASQGPRRKHTVPQQAASSPQTPRQCTARLSFSGETPIVHLGVRPSVAALVVFPLLMRGAMIVKGNLTGTCENAGAGAETKTRPRTGDC